MAGEIHLLHHSFCRGGGMERYAVVLCSTLKSLGYEFHVHARRTDADLARELGITLHPVKVFRFPRKLGDWHFFRKVDGLRHTAKGLQIALSRVRSKDLVICGGTHLSYLRRSHKLMGPFDKMQVWMEREAYRSARVVISHSKLCTEELLSLYAVPEKKVVTLFPPVDAQQFSPPKGPEQILECRKQLGLPSGKIIFLFVSMGHGRKGLAPLCQALSAFANEIVLAVAGKPPQGNWPFVQHLGYVQNMATAYRAADFTILASNYEPFGLVGPESILCGARLVFEKDVGCLAAIKAEATFTFFAADIESIRQAVASAIALARAGGHRIENPAGALLYGPNPVSHAQGLLEAAAKAAEILPDGH